MPKMSGKFTTGPNKGRAWQVYEDPASDTGYTRKNTDAKGTEYFEPFDYAAAEVDDEIAAGKAAKRAAKNASRGAAIAAAAAREEALRQARLKGNERLWNEDVRRYDQDFGLKRDESRSDRKLRGQELKLRELDTRTRMKIGLRELELKEQQMGTDDMRARERNVMDYLGAIGKLRLPYAELQALSQRAVAGIIPGAAAGGGGNNGGGALTPDQWQALAQGTARNWEQSQIGQGSALSG